MMRIAIAAALSLFIVAHSARGAVAELIEVKKIWDQQWVWRVTWHNGVGYGAVYATKVRGSKQIALTIWKTTDGVKYEKIAEPAPTCNPSEATIRFLADDTMVVLVRGEQNDRRD